MPASKTTQQERILDLLKDGHKRTLEEIHSEVGGKLTSVSADLRNLRKPGHGAYPICSTPNKAATPFQYWMGR